MNHTLKEISAAATYYVMYQAAQIPGRLYLALLLGAALLMHG